MPYSKSTSAGLSDEGEAGLATTPDCCPAGHPAGIAATASRSRPPTRRTLRPATARIRRRPCRARRRGARQDVESMASALRRRPVSPESPSATDLGSEFLSDQRCGRASAECQGHRAPIAPSCLQITEKWTTRRPPKWTFKLDRSSRMFGVMNPGILLAFSSALAYGAADFIGGAGSRRHSSWQVVLVGQAAGALVMPAAGFLLPGSPAVLGFRMGAPGRRRLGDREHLPVPWARPRTDEPCGTDLGSRGRSPAGVGGRSPR